jgi:hypothetical protein
MNEFYEKLTLLYNSINLMSQGFEALIREDFFFFFVMRNPVMECFSI